MIKKLNNSIFWLIMMFLSIVVVGIIILFAILNYKNTINTATLMLDRFMDREIKMDMNYKRENGEEIAKNEIDGIYYVQILNSRIVENPNSPQNKAIQEYALEINKENKKSGIIGNYIYKVKTTKGNITNVMFMENKEAISSVKRIIIISIILSIISILIIYVIAKKLSKLIVKPVEKTFEKQKQFISDASHELKTPLAVIEANIDVLENEIGNNKWMNYIQNEIESMDKLINELLLLAKMENIDNLQEYGVLNLSEETKIIVSMFESMAYEKSVELSSNIQENIMINGNKEDTEHIESILIDNAIKHTEAQKQVKVELKKEKNEIILEVKNMGTPIPEEEREKIFERFYRIDKSRNRKEKRYGLGLAIAKAIIEKYNGKIKVDFKDGFTIFKVTWPI